MLLVSKVFNPSTLSKLASHIKFPRRNLLHQETKVAFHLIGATCQFLNGTHEVLRTGSGRNGPAHGSQTLSYPALVGQSAGIWRVGCGGKNVRARLRPSLLNWPEPVLFGRLNRINEKTTQVRLFGIPVDLAICLNFRSQLH